MDGKANEAPPEDVFTWDTVTARMPKIMESVLGTLPETLEGNAALVTSLRELQAEMRDGAPLRMLEGTGPWVNAESWNEHLREFVEKGAGWHDAPWWVVENYMYKRLLEAMARCGDAAAGVDPFAHQKSEALAAAAGPLANSVRPVLSQVDVAASAGADEAPRKAALEATLLRSLWGNQADLSLSSGRVDETAADGGAQRDLVSDDMELGVELLMGARGKNVALVLDNHGLEVICDLALVDGLFRAAEVASVALHVKDSPVFVSDVTADDVPGILSWVEGHDAPLAARLRAWMDEGRLTIVPNTFYTSAKSFWELPADLISAYSEAAVVILKGDANYRRLLGDLHWPFDTDFGEYAKSFWVSEGLISLRTMKSGVALGIPTDTQAEARASHPDDWLTSGTFGQVLASRQTP